MLLIQPKAKIVEKIIRNEFGEALCAYFLVAEFEGKVFWKLLRYEKIAQIKGEISENINKYFFSLPFSVKHLQTTNYKLQTIFSPYLFNTFFTSQMTRAPSL